MTNKYNKPKSASWIISSRFKSNRNFITPNRVKLGKINKNVAYELSSGRSFMRDDGDLYGVSVVSVNNDKWKTRGLHDLSKAFGTKNEAEAHINKLKRIMRAKGLD